MNAPAPASQTATEPPGPVGPPPLDLVRDVDAGSFLESFLVSAVVAMLGIRLFLRLTGYPQLGGGGLHIAHVLWGGLLMLLALVLLLAFLGKRVKRTAAIVGGLGFGAFIDELGKFVTSDNDYFFQPTIGLIYVIFVALFLTFRQIDRHRPPSQEELLVNAADMLKEAIIDGARSNEVDRALTLLARSGLRTGTAEAIRAAIVLADRVGDTPPPLPARLAQALRRAYDRVVGERWFQRAVLVVFVVNSVATLLVAGLALASAGPLAIVAAGRSSYLAAGQSLASLAASAMGLVGVVRLPGSRLDAYRWFKRSVLVSILLVQVFLFFRNELAALGGLAVDLVLLSAVNTLLRAEYGRQEATLVARAGLRAARAPSAAP